MKKFNDYINESKLDEKKIKSYIEFGKEIDDVIKKLRDIINKIGGDEWIEYVETTDEKYDLETLDISFGVQEDLEDALTDFRKFQREFMGGIRMRTGKF